MVAPSSNLQRTSMRMFDRLHCHGSLPKDIQFDETSHFPTAWCFHTVKQPQKTIITKSSSFSKLANPYKSTNKLWFTPQKTNMTMEKHGKTTIWRCISYSTWWFSSQPCFRGVFSPFFRNLRGTMNPSSPAPPFQTRRADIPLGLPNTSLRASLRFGPEVGPDQWQVEGPGGLYKYMGFPGAKKTRLGKRVCVFSSVAFRELTCPNSGKGKSSTQKCRQVGDMLVPRRVIPETIWWVLHEFYV